VGRSAEAHERTSRESVEMSEDGFSICSRRVPFPVVVMGSFITFESPDGRCIGKMVPTIQLDRSEGDGRRAGCIQR
jgi:hypothetical protein